MPTSTRTLLLALHDPSRRTAAVLHRALRAYTTAARAVLDAAERDWDQVRAAALHRDKLNGLMLATELRTRYRRRTMPYPLHASLREALFADLAGALASYDALALAWDRAAGALHDQAAALGIDLAVPAPITASKDELAARTALGRKLKELGARPSFPTAPRTRPDEAAYQASLDRITSATPDDPPTPRGQGRLQDLLTTGTRPLWFPRPDGPSGSRNFALLHSDDDKYYALLYLLPGGDPRARPLTVPPPGGARGALTALNKEGKMVSWSRRPSSALCLPLACGRWHEETALADALTHPRTIRVAKLIHRPAERRFGGTQPERFYLAVTVEQEIPEPFHTAAWLGVSLDERGMLAWCVRDRADGAVLEQGVRTELYDLATRWREDRRMQMRAGRLPPRAHHIQAEQVRHGLHHITNHLTERAARYCAVIGVEDTTYRRAMPTMAPLDESTGRRAARGDAWHEAAAERNYRQATQVSGELTRMLAYKLLRAGAPIPLSVGGVSPRDCAACGGRGTTKTACGLCGAPLGVHNSAAVTAARIEAIAAKRRAAWDKRQAERDAAAAKDEQSEDDTVEEPLDHEEKEE